MHAWKPHAVAVHECHNCGVSRRPTAAPETIACMQSSKARASARSFESQVSLRTYTCAQASPRPARTLSIEKCETARCTGCSCEVGGGGKESEQENTLQSIRRTGARLHMRDGVSCLCTHSGHRMTRKAVDGKGGRRKRGTSRRMIRKRSDAGSGITTFILQAAFGRCNIGVASMATCGPSVGTLRQPQSGSLPPLQSQPGKRLGAPLLLPVKV
mmetsp:Transcript_4619/g.15138  ORF Transcript_4619/g.15138 Transcript_4619/m.15138 type:complete len:214 (+) Transcript_4619:2081-2722(+)